MRHAQKVIIITGAGRGMGEACAKRFIAEGARGVVLNDLDGDALHAVAADIQKDGGKAVVVAGSAADRDVANELVTQADRAFGTLDTLVCCAGGGGPGTPEKAPGPVIGDDPRDFLNIPEDAWDATYEGNMKTAFLPGQAVARYMVERGIRGSIVNIASVQAVQASGNGAPYCATKAGVVNLTKGMAVSLAPYGIRVNAIGPGATATRMLLGTTETDLEFSRMLQSCTPLGRWAEPDEMAAPIAFLASEEASFITGQTLYVDGGMLAHCFVMPPLEEPVRYGRQG